MSVEIQFLGAAGTVTGSKYLVTYSAVGSETRRILVDCGMFQGDRAWRECNWEKLSPEVTSEVDACLITHAHVDHTGMLPRFWNQGLRCPIYCTKATRELSQVLLMDAAALQEEEAEYRGETGRSRHHPPLPLYTKQDAEQALSLFRVVRFGKSLEVLPGITAQWATAGHILGAASIRLEIGGRVINFSGDVGRFGVPILKDPEKIEFGDLLLVESTYGDTEHPPEDPREQLATIINRTVQRRGVVLVPSFAVGRTQNLLFYLRELKAQRRIPDIPIVIDSPMAADATSIYLNNPADYDEEALKLLMAGKHPFEPSKLHFVRDRNESKRLNSIPDSMVLISASGMLSGGRVLHHLKHRVDKPQNTILFVGFQPPGGRGAWIKSGSQSVRIFGEEVPIRAEIAEISGLSAHADRSELVRWLASGTGAPGQVMVVHGEPDTAQSFKSTIESHFGWNVKVAEFRQTIAV